jgi:hypothetical protein
MKKKLIIALLTALMPLSMMGLLVACDGGDGAAAGGSEEPAEIQVFKQNSNGIEITNYQIVLKQSAEEWNALSAEEQGKIALSGYNDVQAKIAEDGVSNYNVTGQTAPGKDAEGAATPTQIAFILNHETGKLQLLGAEGNTTSEVATEASEN